ncbi:MAG: glycosyltransferase family 2 protein [Methylovirgula sp.]
MSLILDADFVPYRNILKRTLGLFAEPDIGIVQTPQHFFNPDPIQNNLAMTRVWPDEQRFFFNTLLDSKDAWGAAFCCGTSAVFRVDALVAAGGMATETVTEDMLTSFKFSEHGFRTIFLNEMLSMGLAPEGLSSYISQRSRWCLGAIQQMYTRWSFAGAGENRYHQPDFVLRRRALLDQQCALQNTDDHRAACLLVDADGRHFQHGCGDALLPCALCRMLDLFHGLLRPQANYPDHDGRDAITDELLDGRDRRNRAG